MKRAYQLAWLISCAGFDRLIKTHGESTWKRWSERASYISIGLILGGVALSVVVPPLAPVGEGMVMAGIGVGTGGSVLSLYDNLKQEDISVINVTVDILSIATNLLGAAGVIQSAVKEGFGAAGLHVMKTQTGRVFVYLAFATGTSAGVLMSKDAVFEIARIIQSPLPPWQKFKEISKCAVVLLFQGGLVAVSVYGMKYAKIRLQKVLSPAIFATLLTDEVYLLNMLNAEALQQLSTLTRDQLRRLLEFLRINPKVAAALMASPEAASLFKVPVLFEGRHARLFNRVSMEWPVILELSRQRKLNDILGVLRNWQTQLSWTEINTLLQRIGPELLTQLDGPQLAKLGNLGPQFAQRLGLAMSRKDRPNGQILQMLIRQYARHEQFENYFGVVRARRFNLGVLENTPVSVLARLQQLSDEEFGRALALFKANAREAEALMASANGLDILKQPFTFEKGKALRLSTGVTLELPLLYKLSERAQLRGILEVAGAAEQRYGATASRAFWQRVPGVVFEEVPEMLPLLTEDFVDASWLQKFTGRLTKAKLGSAAKAEDFFQAWAETLQEFNGDHEVSRHVINGTLEEYFGLRMHAGLVKDAGMTTGFKFSPPGRFVTGFSSYKELLNARREAYKALQEAKKINFEELIPNSPSSPRKYEVTVEHGRPIGGGLVGIGEGELTSYMGKTGRIYAESIEVTGLTRSKIRAIWDDVGKKWKIIQFFPEAKDWDNILKKYVGPSADIILSGEK